MFGWFKKKSRCRHFKGFGEPYPDNMRRVMTFSPYKTDGFGYSISECKECGKRAFGCLGHHLMGKELAENIDAFIAYEITLDQFIVVLKEHGCWYKLENANSAL